MPLDQFSERVPQVGYFHFGGSYTPGTLETLLDPNGQTCRIDAAMVANYDSVAHDIGLALFDGTNNLDLGGVSCPAGDGIGNVAHVTDLIAAILPAGQPFILIPSGWQLKVSDQTAVVDAGANVLVQGGAF